MYLCGMVRQSDQEGAGFLSNPVRRGNNGIRAPTQPYEVRLVSFPAMKEPAHLALHPFGQIPTYEEGDLARFETGAIVFHIAEHHAGLLPEDANARARAITWMFAALNTVEERREVGGASGQSYLGARLGLSFKGLTVAGTPNFSTLPDGALQRVAYP